MGILKELDYVALTRDIPEYRLVAGNIGIVLQLDSESAIVEFLDRDGGTFAILAVSETDLRMPTSDEIENKAGPEPLPPGVHVAIASAVLSETDVVTPDDLSAKSPALSHIDAAGRARMVDVTSKDETLRVAVAGGRIVMQPETLRLLLAGEIAKGNVLTTAQIAGVMAAKRTHELIPMCHPLLLTGIDVELEPDEAASAVEIRATVRTTGKTGVEMEALTAVSVAGLTVYDMCKAVDRGMQIEGVRLISKSGGASGDYRAE
jgi:cyclic pyranopterin monophosphate synthase